MPTTSESTGVADAATTTYYLVAVDMESNDAVDEALLSEWFPINFARGRNGRFTTGLAMLRDHSEILTFIMRTQFLFGKAFLISREGFESTMAQLSQTRDRSRVRILVDPRTEVTPRLWRLRMTVELGREGLAATESASSAAGEDGFSFQEAAAAIVDAARAEGQDLSYLLNEGAADNVSDDENTIAEDEDDDEDNSDDDEHHDLDPDMLDHTVVSRPSQTEILTPAMLDEGARRMCEEHGMPYSSSAGSLL